MKKSLLYSILCTPIHTSTDRCSRYRYRIMTSSDMCEKSGQSYAAENIGDYAGM
jgi:hypothetical protein